MVSHATRKSLILLNLTQAYGPTAPCVTAVLPRVLDAPSTTEGRTALLGTAPDDVTAHSYVYGRHPSFLPVITPAEAHLSERYGVDSRATEMALLQLRNASAARGDKLHVGYHRPQVRICGPLHVEQL